MNTYPRSITISTPKGDAIAVQPEKKEWWTINFPWSGIMYSGYASIKEVTSFMKREISNNS